MRIDWDTPVDVLMHGGDVQYVDLDEDEIMHWKYIKRKKLPNGKWRYYYDYGQYAKADMEKAAQDRKYYKEESDAAREAYYWNVDKFFDATRAGDKKERDKYYEYSKNAYNYSKRMSDRFIESIHKHEYTIRKYEDTPLYKITETKTKIKKGVKAISNLLSGLFKNKK